jgi:hypothetical protein
MENTEALAGVTVSVVLETVRCSAAFTEFLNKALPGVTASIRVTLVLNLAKASSILRFRATSPFLLMYTQG